MTPLANHSAADSTCSPEASKLLYVKYSEREMTPIRQKLFKLYELLVRYVLMLLFTLALINLLAPAVFPWMRAAGVVLQYGAMYLLALLLGRSALQRKITFRMTEKYFSVRTLWGWRNFERAVEHQFIMYAHEKTQDEQLELERQRQVAANKGKVLKLKPIYGRSAHLAILYAGQTYVFMTVYDMTRAEAVVRRLIHHDRNFDAAIDKAKSWKDGPFEVNSPGSLP